MLGVTSSNLAYRSVRNEGCYDSSNSLFLLGNHTLKKCLVASSTHHGSKLRSARWQAVLSKLSRATQL